MALKKYFGDIKYIRELQNEVDSTFFKESFMQKEKTW